MRALRAQQDSGRKGSRARAQRLAHERKSTTLVGWRIQVGQPTSRTADNDHGLPVTKNDCLADRDPLTRESNDRKPSSRRRTRTGCNSCLTSRHLSKREQHDSAPPERRRTDVLVTTAASDRRLVPCWAEERLPPRLGAIGPTPRPSLREGLEETLSLMRLGIDKQLTESRALPTRIGSVGEPAVWTRLPLPHCVGYVALQQVTRARDLCAPNLSPALAQASTQLWVIRESTAHFGIRLHVAASASHVALKTGARTSPDCARVGVM